MSILKPINYAGAWEFKRPVPCPASDILGAPLVSVSFNEDWIPAVMSAMKALTRPEAYEGTLSDIQRCTLDAHSLLDYSTPIVGGAVVGEIVPHTLASLPSNWLACDGATHLRVDWPDLYAVLHSAYILDADHFKTPDLRGRSPLGSGAGSGLTSRAVGDSGGEENHALSVGELASHNHVYFYNEAAWVVGAQVLQASGNPVKNSSTQNAGSGTGHNTMHPFLAVQFAVVAA